jgi:hypothetical protein
MSYTAKIRDGVTKLMTFGKEYTVTHFDRSSQDLWGRTDTTGTPTTERLFVVRKYTGFKKAREGVKEVEYILAIASSSSVLEVGDKIEIDSADYWVEGAQLAELEDGASLFKRIRAIKEEYA